MASIINNRFFLSVMLACIALVLGGCSKPSVVTNGVMTVEISGKSFALDIVADQDTRVIGLGGRHEMDADKGMIFSFTDSKVRRFLMRDCFFDIDIIFLDSAGRITAMHTMPAEEPKGDDESAREYENRLPTYSSRYNAKYAIELVGGMLETLDLKDGQQIELDIEYLEAITQ